MWSHPSPGATLATKLTPPTKRSGLVERPELMARIDRALDQRLQLVCAPAGYGKTSVLVQLYAKLFDTGRRVCWISLDEGDKDLSRFILYLVDAIRLSGSRFGQGLLTLLGSGATVPLDTLKTLFVNELATLDQDTYLFLDDYHLVGAGEIRDLINALLLSPIRSLRLAIASRNLNALPVSRLRALGQVHEIEIADLVFTDHEVEEFVTKVRGMPLAPGQAARLREETEGWAASLQMAGIALRGIGDVDAFLRGFTGAHKSVGDFLGDEVLRRQPERLQDFLIGTSILKRFNTSVCNAVMGTRDARTMINEAEHLNLFLFSLDPERQWYRYHHLFSDFLRRRLEESDPDLACEYHRRASKWFAEHRYPVEAIEHSFQAGDLDRAGELLDTTCSDLFAAGQTATLTSLSSRLPVETRERLPRLQLELAWYSELSWNFVDARLALDRVQAVLEQRSLELDAEKCPDLAYLRAKLAHRWMMLSLLSDDMPLAEKLARQWLQAERTQDAFMCASAGTAVMAGQRDMFRCEGVVTSGRMLHDRFVEGGALYGVVFHQCIVGSTFSMRGDLDLAQEAYERALQVAVELHGEHSALYNMPALMFAELYYERGQLRQAEEMLAQRDITSNLGFADNLIAGFVTRARMMRMSGRGSEAESLLGEGAWLAEQYRFDRLQAHLLDERVLLMLSAGRTKEAAALMRDTCFSTKTSAKPAPSEGITVKDGLIAVSSARLMIETGSEREALALLKPWFTFTRARHCHRAAIRLGLVLTKALARSGDRRAALRTLGECLVLGEAGGFVRSFVDEGAEIVEMISELDAAQPLERRAESHRYMQSLLASGGVDRATAHPSPAAQDNSSPGSQDALSPRELQILELGARGLQNPDIAQTLCLSESTVKWYWQRIFDKLDTRRRPDAIKRARQLHWIS